MAGNDEKPCWGCLKKRRVCDLTRPRCLKCLSRGVQCPGYDKKPLKWLHPGQTRSKGRRAKDEAGYLVVYNDAPATVPPCLPSEDNMPYEATLYFNAAICPDLEALGAAGEDSVYFVPTSALPHLPTVYFEIMMCSAIGHRLLQSDSKSEKTVALGRRLQKHRGNAINQISALIALPSSQYTDQTVGIVIVFLLSEIQQSIAQTWRFHSEGAYAILQARGGVRDALLARPYMTHLLRYLILIDIIGTTTTSHTSLQQVDRQLALCDLLMPVFGDALETAIPCSHELLHMIILVNQQRALRAAHRLTVVDAFNAMFTILGQIMAFSAAAWADAMSASQRRLNEQRNKHLKPGQRQYKTWNWTAVGRAYQAAVALYCVTSLTHVHEIAKESTNQECRRLSEVSSVKESCRRSLVESLTEIATGDVPQLRKLVFWPVAIAGIVSPNDADGSRTFVISELLHISRALGTAAALIAKDFLLGLWRSPAEQAGNWQDWESKFDRPYVFTI